MPTSVIARWLLVAGLAGLTGLFAYAIGIQATRLALPQLLLGVFLTVILGGAAVAIAMSSRSLKAASLRQERAEAAAQASEEGFRTVAATMADGIVTIDEKSRIQSVNPAAERMFGYSARELEGREITILMPEGYPPRHLRSFRRYLETGERHVAWAGIEFPGLQKSGRVIPLEVSLGEYSVGGRRFFTGILRDVSERKQADEALARSEEKFRGIFESAADGIFVVDDRGLILDVNPAGEALLGRERAELLRTEIGRLISPGAASPWGGSVHELMASVLAGELYEGVATAPDGRELRVRLSSQLIRREAAGPQYVIIARNVTEQSELQRKLLESERSATMGRLASFVAHEINTPLTNISLLTSSIGRRVTDPEVQIRLKKISDQGKIAAHITKYLLKFSKPRSANLVDTDLRELVQGAVEQADVFRKPDVAVRVDPPDHPLSIRVDPVRMQEVFVNLLKNAYEATSHGAVEIRIEERDDSLAVTISDTGTGIPLEVRKHMFEPFVTTKPKGEGTGLGLALSKTFVVGHGGDISVSSEVGKGSVFTVRLPRAGPDTTRGPPAAGSPALENPPSELFDPPSRAPP